MTTIDRLNEANIGGAKTLELINIKHIAYIAPIPASLLCVIGRTINFVRGYSRADSTMFHFKNGDLICNINNTYPNGDKLEETVIQGILPKDNPHTLVVLSSLINKEYIAIVTLLNDYDNGEPMKLLIGNMESPAVLLPGRRSAGANIQELNFADFSLLVTKKEVTPFAYES